MKQIDKMKFGLKEPEEDILPRPEESPDLKPPEQVAVEIIPLKEGPVGQVMGCALRLSTGDSEDQKSITSALSAPQMRELARQFLVIADAASQGATRSFMAITNSEMWKLPGQHLMIRCTPETHMDFAVKPANMLNGKIAIPDKRLILPGR